MAEYFFLEQPTVGTIRLPLEEARHLVKSLRKGVGDEVHFTDGKGTLITAVIEVDDYADFSARIL
ncbi:MAG: RNA methyltransferase PUA domain-containing protein, partial [Flavobacteriales bacterium]